MEVVEIVVPYILYCKNARCYKLCLKGLSKYEDGPGVPDIENFLVKH